MFTSYESVRRDRGSFLSQVTVMSTGGHVSTVVEVVKGPSDNVRARLTTKLTDRKKVLLKKNPYNINTI